MIKPDYARPMKSNGVTGLGWLLREFLKYAACILIIMFLGAEWWPM